MRRRLVVLLALVTTWVASSSSATDSRIWGFVERGGSTVATGSQTSTTKVQQSYPQATVTVYDAGTTNLATIHTDSTGLVNKANPFAADVYGYWYFYTAAGNRFDVKFSGGGIASPYTLYDIEILSGAGGAVSSVFGRTGAVSAATSDYDAIQVDNTPAGNIASTNVQTALNELDTEKTTLAAATAAAPVQSVFSRTGAVAATAGDYTAAQVTNVPAGTVAAITVQAAVNELDTEKVTSAGAAAAAPVQSVFSRTGAVVAATSDYDAIQVDNTPAGAIAATNVQAAIDELDTEKSATGHTHAASAITNTPAGGIAAADVQAAVNELDTEKAASTHTHAASDVTSGSLAVARGGTALGALGAANTVLGVDTGGTALEYKSIAVTAPITVTPAAGSLTIACPTCSTTTSGVDSFIGRVGAVVAAASDYDANLVDVTPAGTIASTDVQAALEELDTEKSTTSHTHSTYVTTNTDQTVAGAKTFTKQYVASLYSQAFGTTMDVNWNNGNVQTVTLTANITTLTFSNGISGGRYVLLMQQDGTGSRTVSWPASVLWPGATAPTMSGVSKMDLIGFVYNGTTYYGSYSTNY